MARVTVEPVSLTFEVQPGENILAAAVNAGIRWPTVCHGVGNCKTCYFMIRQGHDRCSPITPFEAEALYWVRRRHADVPEENLRLACQTSITGDVLVYCKAARAPAD